MAILLALMCAHTALWCGCLMALREDSGRTSRALASRVPCWTSPEELGGEKGAVPLPLDPDDAGIVGDDGGETPGSVGGVVSTTVGG